MPETPENHLRERLLESALAIVDAKGAEGLTVRAVAKAAGCSTMGVYTHFNGKAGLVDAVVGWGFESLNDAMSAACQAADGGRDGLLAAAEAYREWALRHQMQFHAMFAPAAVGLEASEATSARMWETFYAHRARVAAVFDSADADPSAWHETAARLWVVFHGHVMIELLHQTYGADRTWQPDFTAEIERALGETVGAAAG